MNIIIDTSTYLRIPQKPLCIPFSYPTSIRYTYTASPGFSFTHTYYTCIFIYRFNYIHPDCSRFFWIESFRFWEILGERCSFYLDGLQWAAEKEIGGASLLIAFGMIVFMHVYTLFMDVYYVYKCVQDMFLLFIYVWW